MHRFIVLCVVLLSTACSETSINKLAGPSGDVDEPEMDTGASALASPLDEEEDVDPGSDDSIDEPPPTDDDPTDEITDTGTPDDDDFGGGGFEDYVPPPEDDCDYTSDLVYVIDRDTETIHLFDPETLTFDALGTIDCHWLAGSPASMSVSRDGSAYVRYGDDTVYEVDLETLDCTESDYATDFGAFGMGYATDTASTWRDSLYIANSGQLALVDTTTWSVTNIGSMPSQSELTGNADGELWAILPLETPAKLVQLHKDNASVLDTITLSGLPSLTEIDTFAFATWGGDFFVFIRSYGMGSSTDVYQVSASGSMSRVVANSGLNVVGAGVSTCAPAS